MTKKDFPLRCRKGWSFAVSCRLVSFSQLSIVAFETQYSPFASWGASVQEHAFSGLNMFVRAEVCRCSGPLFLLRGIGRVCSF